MSIKEELTNDQLRDVIGGPITAATYVAMSSGGSFELVRELLSVSKFVAAQVSTEGASGYGELVDELLGILKNMTKEEQKELAPDQEQEKATSIEAARSQMREIVANGWAAVSGRPGAEGYARWVMDTARQAAETKTGGFLGIGSKSVTDEQEQAALSELAAIVGV